MTSSVCGETTSMTSVPRGSVNSPPMNSCPCSTSSVMADCLPEPVLFAGTFSDDPSDSLE
jgi:hypothetical protein